MRPNRRPHRGEGRGPSRNQMEWVHRNRQRSVRAQPLGELVRRFDVTGASGNRIGRRVFETIGELVDDEFRHHCTFEGVAGGEVSILVRSAEMLYYIRTKWQARLLARLRQACPPQTVRRVLFSVAGSDHQDQPTRRGAFFLP